MQHHLANRLDNVQTSATVAMNTRAIELQQQGLNVISLAAGEPDFDTPQPVVDAAIDALQKGKTRYAPPSGIAPLRQAIANYLSKTYDSVYLSEQVAVTSGGKQAIFNALMATLNPDDEVVIPAPYWVSFVDIVKLFEAKPIVLQCASAQNFKLQPSQLEDSLNSNTKWLILNNPSNPTGALYHEEELRNLANILCKREYRHVMILCDDIYSQLVYPPSKFIHLVQVAPELKQRILMINGFSKPYAMTGWRLGYAAGPLEIIQQMIKIQSQSSTCANTFVQWAGIAALEMDQSFNATILQALLKRRDFVMQACHSILGLNCIKPEGAFYAYIECAAFMDKTTPSGGIIKTDFDLAMYLLEYSNVACVHGGAFGLEPYLRFSYTVSDELLAKAMVQIKDAFMQLT